MSATPCRTVRSRIRLFLEAHNISCAKLISITSEQHPHPAVIVHQRRRASARAVHLISLTFFKLSTCRRPDAFVLSHLADLLSKHILIHLLGRILIST